MVTLNCNTALRTRLEMSDSNTLSIVVPIKSMSGRLQQVAKLLQNPDLEVILVHDWADDQTGKELRDLVSISKAKALLIEGLFGSPGAARNAGLTRCTSDYVAFFDSDDENFAGERTYECLTNCDKAPDIIGNAFEVQENPSLEIFAHPAPLDLAHALMRQPGIWRYIFRKAFLEFEEISFTEIKMGEDILFLLDCYRARPVYMGNEVRSYRYIIGNSMQATQTLSARRDLTLLAEELRSRFAMSSNESDRKLISYLWARSIGSGMKLLDNAGRAQIMQLALAGAARNPGILTKSIRQFRALLQSMSSLTDSNYLISESKDE